MREPEEMSVSSTEPTEYAAPETRHSCEIDSNGTNFSVHIAQELRQECTNFKRILEEIKPSEIDVVAGKHLFIDNLIHSGAKAFTQTWMKLNKIKPLI